MPCKCRTKRSQAQPSRGQRKPSQRLTLPAERARVWRHPSDGQCRQKFVDVAAVDSRGDVVQTSQSAVHPPGRRPRGRPWSPIGRGCGQPLPMRNPRPLRGTSCSGIHPRLPPRELSYHTASSALPINATRSMPTVLWSRIVASQPRLTNEATSRPISAEGRQPSRRFLNDRRTSGTGLRRAGGRFRRPLTPPAATSRRCRARRRPARRWPCP